MKKFLKKVLSAYVKGFNEMHGPAIKAGINPFLQCCIIKVNKKKSDKEEIGLISSVLSNCQKIIC